MPAPWRSWRAGRSTACEPGPRTAAAFLRRPAPPTLPTAEMVPSARRRRTVRPTARRPIGQPSRRASDAMGGTGVIDSFLAVFTQYIDSGFGLLGGEVAFIATTLIVDRHDAGRALLVLGRRRGHHRAPRQEDALRRRLRLSHRQLEQPLPHRLRELRRAWPESLRHRACPRRISCGPAGSLRSASTPAAPCSTRSPA